MFGKKAVLAGLAGVALVVGMAAAPAASAAPATLVDCSADASALQPAINAASSGATLTVTGICVGIFTIDKDLTLTRGGSAATLDGNGTRTVLAIQPGASVTLDRLIITGGGEFTSGGGIFNSGGTVTLNGGTVTGNFAGSTGGGIVNFGGTVIMNGGSTVAGN